MLDFYCSYRAYVRGKVTSLFLQEALPEQARLYAQQQAECLFDLAARYARRLHRPRCILTTGLIGSGKSTMGQAVAAALALPVISSDRLRISATGAVLDTPQNAAYGSGMYSVAARDQVYDKLAAVAREHLQQGRSILLDASFSSRAQRQRLVELAQTLDADCGILECWAPEAVLRQRLRQRDQAPASNSEARENILQAFERHYEPVQAAEFPWHIRLDTSQDVMDCAQAALAMLQARQS
jgi:hypothetical protein